MVTHIEAPIASGRWTALTRRIRHVAGAAVNMAFYWTLRVLVGLAFIAALAFIAVLALRQEVDPTVRASLLLALLAGLTVVAVRYWPAPLRFTNRALPDRLKNLVDMIERAEREIVIVTGALHHAVFADPVVVAAMASVPDRVRVSLYYTGSRLDPLSQDFIHLLQERCVEPRHVIEPNVRHAVVVDARFVKLEELEVPDTDSAKRAEYFFYASRIGKNVLAQIRKLKTEAGEFPPTE
ncbi:MAG: hypothetical protein ABL883_06460 [Terricaulis sp.]